MGETRIIPQLTRLHKKNFSELLIYSHLIHIIFLFNFYHKYITCNKNQKQLRHIMEIEHQNE